MTPSSGAPRARTKRRRRRSGGLRIIGERRGRRGFGAQGVGVLADARDRSLDPPRRATQPVHDADLTQRSVLGMFDVGDRILGAQRGVGERFLRRAHRLQRDTGFGRDTDPLVAGEARDRLGHLREVVREDDQVLGVGRHAVGVVVHTIDVATQCQRVAVGAREHELRVRDPLLDPALVRAAEEPLRRALVGDPRAVAGRVVVLRALPLARRHHQRGLEHRRLDVLPATGVEAREQRRVDAHRREERGAHAEPRRVGEDRSRSGRARSHSLGDLEVGKVGLVAVHVGDRAAEVSALLVHDAEARRHQRVVAGARPVSRMASVRRDRAVDEARIVGEQRRRVDPEPLRRARRVALEQHVGIVREREEGCVVARRAEVELDAATTTQPCGVAGCAAERIATRRLDLHHIGSVIGEQHPGDRAGDAPRQVEHPHSVQHAGHGRLLCLSVADEHRAGAARAHQHRGASGTWFTAVPRSCRVASRTRFSPWM